MEAVKAGIRDRVGPVLGYYRALPAVLSRAQARVLLARTTVPTLRLHGADDGCVGVEIGAGEARYHAGGFEAHVIAGAGHFLQRERGDEVSRRLLAFFGPPGA
jgi:pimeloyl-ACP methyl ester carboxylesterase